MSNTTHKPSRIGLRMDLWIWLGGGYSGDFDKRYFRRVVS